MEFPILLGRVSDPRRVEVVEYVLAIRVAGKWEKVKVVGSTPLPTPIFNHLRLLQSVYNRFQKQGPQLCYLPETFHQ